MQGQGREQTRFMRRALARQHKQPAGRAARRGAHRQDAAQAKARGIQGGAEPHQGIRGRDKAKIAVMAQQTGGSPGKERQGVALSAQRGFAQGPWRTPPVPGQSPGRVGENHVPASIPALPCGRSANIRNAEVQSFRKPEPDGIGPSRRNQRRLALKAKARQFRPAQGQTQQGRATARAQFQGGAGP